ncbi:MAG: epoxyqueuosine reductase [Ruminococcaceae bacterium]|nr:epoxyqueuosine reductase [Oscillospiraceae bacterium]
MRSEIREFFEKEKIEYYSVLDYKDAVEINPRLRERAGVDAKSIVIFLLPYYSGETENLSRYAASRDYHLIIKDITSKLCSLICELYPGSISKGFGDHSPIDERGAALISGLGILGENGLIINEKYGSYVFIADVITDVPSEALGASKPVPVLKCNNCGLCKKACPTGILRGESAECLSAITQKKGELSEEEIRLMLKFGTVWGCDICQSICPHNKEPKLTPIEFFREKRIEKLTLKELNRMDDESFSERAFAWRGKKTVERNLKFYENANNK